MSVEAETLEHQGVELPGEEIGEIESAGSLLGEGCEPLLTGEGRIAMRARQARHARRGQHGIERPARAAIGIRHEDPVMRLPGVADRVAYRTRDQLRPVVQGCRQAAQIEMREPVRLDDGDDLAGESPTSDDQGALHRCTVRRGRHAESVFSMLAEASRIGLAQAITRCWLCFLAMKRWAVSTATEASRQ